MYLQFFKSVGIRPICLAITKKARLSLSNNNLGLSSACNNLSDAASEPNRAESCGID